ncbi:MAG: hypothetical protein Q9187_008014 [Circinaria calcarea]
MADSLDACRFGFKCKFTEPIQPLLAFLTSLSPVRLSSIRTLTLEIDPTARRTRPSLPCAFRKLVTHCPHLRTFYLVFDAINPGVDCARVKGIEELMQLRGLEECGVRGRFRWETVRDVVRRRSGETNGDIMKKLVREKGVGEVVWEEEESVMWEFRGVLADGLRAAWRRPRVEE